MKSISKYATMPNLLILGAGIFIGYKLLQKFQKPPVAALPAVNPQALQAQNRAVAMTGVTLDSLDSMGCGNAPCPPGSGSCFSEIIPPSDEFDVFQE